MRTALSIECTGCGAEIVSGHAFVNDQGWFHNEICVKAYWQTIGYTPGADKPKAKGLRNASPGKVIDWLNAAVTDWDGSRMRDGEPPRGFITCRDLRDVAEMIERLDQRPLPSPPTKEGT
jgi:hypothetical protein